MESLFAGQDAAAAPWRPAWNVYLQHGTLARRILRAVGEGPDAALIRDVYARLCNCLQAGELFVA
jgi:hypothetical protein